MKTTANYALQIPEATDTVNLLTQNYPNFETIDKAMKANKDAAITTATEVKTGTNHAIIRSNTDANMFRFVATSNMVAGDTFTVDSVVCTATTPDGQSLGNGAFVINQNVLCCLVGTLLTIYAGGSSASEVELAKNAEKLGGELPEFYGTADAVTANTQAIDGLVNDVDELKNREALVKYYGGVGKEVQVGTWKDIPVYRNTYKFTSFNNNAINKLTIPDATNIIDYKVIGRMDINGTNSGWCNYTYSWWVSATDCWSTLSTPQTVQMYLKSPNNPSNIQMYAIVDYTKDAISFD